MNRPRKLLTPKQAREFCRREEARMRAEEKRRLEPHLAQQLRQIVKIAGKPKVLAFLEEL